ncbi:sodium-dependent transporter [Parasutterella excrementihominis]|uniref:sodium-dependent transporter n=1 Tax=Parasutterella excrementihominis TaxID=487175 RepID=UPI00242E5737|nr:sodium-dependent transporter [Parasutterella excrementihominis]
MASNSTWGSRIGFILASAGSAVGLGAIWKFPYLAGNNGGSVFLLSYLLFTFTVGVAMLISEYVIGREGRMGAIGSLKKVVGKHWGVFGTVGVVTAFAILCFYSCVGGWCIKYLIDAFTGTGIVSNADELNKNFGSFVSNGALAYFYQIIFLLANAVIVSLGVQKGIERLAKFLMPVLFILMLILIVRGLTLPGAVKGLEYLFKPNWSGFTSSAIFNAMGFTFFSLSLGAAVMVTYAGYLSEKVNLLTSTAWVAFLAIMAAVLGGLMVMPAVFAFNLSPTAGPGLTFVTMPAIFSQMPFGVFFAILFYFCLVVAAITSSMSMLEAVVASVLDYTRLSRAAVTWSTTALAAFIGLFCTLSFGSLSDFKIFGKNVFDLLDFLTSNVGMPLSEIGFSVAAAWISWKVTAKQLTSAGPVQSWLLWAIRIVIGILSPLLIITVVMTGLL